MSNVIVDHPTPGVALLTLNRPEKLNAMHVGLVSDLHAALGKEFITVYTEVKEIEHEEFMKVISPWEREHLLLHV